MLQQETEEKHALSAGLAAMRVTPEELAQAAAALEMRQLAEQQRQSETISLDEAIRLLDLDLPPDQLLAQVEAQRTHRQAAQQQQVASRSRSRLFVLGISTLCLAALGTLGLYTLHLRRQLQALQPPSSLPIQTLVTVPDNQPVHCDLTTLNRVAAGDPPGSISVDARPETTENEHNGAFNREWTVLKSGGDVLVQVWATPDEALKATNMQDASVYSNRPPWLPASNVVTLRLPVDRFNMYIELLLDAQGSDAKEIATGIVSQVAVPGMTSVLNDAIANILGGVPRYTHSATHHEMNSLSWQKVNNELHLQGYVGKQSRRQEVEASLARMVAAHHYPFRVVNDIVFEAAHDPGEEELEP